MRYIGIDLAITGKHCAAVVDQAGQTLRQGILFRTQSDELAQLLELAGEGAQADEELAVVMEPTGLAWLPVASYLRQRDITVYMVGTRQMADLRKYYHRYVKGDRKDAVILGHLPLIDPENMIPLYLPDARMLAGQRWCKQYDQLVELGTAVHNRVCAWEHELWCGLQSAIGKSWKGWEPAWRKSPWYTPTRVLDADPGELVEALQACGAPEEKLEQLAKALREAARECLAVNGRAAAVDYESFHESIICEVQRWEFYQGQQAELKKKIIALYRTVQPQRQLETLYGVGELSAAVYTFFIGDIRRFSTQAQFRSWSGMVPATRQSGEAEAKGLSITQAGPDPVKKYAYLNAEVGRRFDPEIAAIYYDQMVNKGKHHKQAICHCATHLLDRIRAVLRDGRPYELRDMDGRPVSPKEARQIVAERYHVPDAVRRSRNARNRRQVSQAPPAKRRRGHPVGKKLTQTRHFIQDDPLHDKVILQPT